ncbi:MAG: respiratory nitrate reductase subunit gamma [Anaerolineae bacterium]|nr:respiratory nitrate reductase subunit gamma [Anaerolineae bacterium]
MNAENIFWLIHLPLMGLFLLGMADVIGVWLRGRVEGAGRSKVGALLQTTLATIFSAQLPRLVKSFVTEAWFNRRLWQTNRWRWLSHFLLLTGFMLLMSMSGIAAIADKVLYHVFHLGHIPWVSMWYTADHPVTAILNEVGGVMMTAGFLFFVIRRYFSRTSQLRTGPMDNWMVIGLGLILLSGWIAEIVRLNSSHAEGLLYLSFVGYPLARLFAGLPLPWDLLVEWLYVGHGILTSLVIVTIPYSKFMHVIAGGLSATVNHFQAETAHGTAKGGAHV